MIPDPLDKYGTLDTWHMTWDTYHDKKSQSVSKLMTKVFVEQPWQNKIGKKKYFYFYESFMYIFCSK